MLDLLFVPAAILLGFALWAVHQGDHRLHGHLMAATVTVVGLRILLHPRDLASHHLALWVALLAMAGTTLLLGRGALAWREGRRTRSTLPRIHRAFGTATLIGLALTTLVWLLRNRA